MATIFCCSSVSPYRPRRLDHDDKFTAFMRWTASYKPSAAVDNGSTILNTAPYAVQLVKQANFGPQESIRYFVPLIDGSRFTETTEDSLIESNFEKLNSYKNFRCSAHNKFFEVNLYQKHPTNRHHWRSTLARPSRDIDLAFRRQEAEAESSKVGASAAEQEKKQDITASDKRKVTIFPKLQKSLLPTLQEADDTTYEEMEPSKHIDMATLKSVLRFLLPTVGQSLGSSSLISLLCLDWVSTELNLGLKLEDLWEAEINISNIIMFFVDCFAVDDAFVNLTVDIAEIEGLVIPAIRYVESHKGDQAPGKLKLHKIVKRVLESGRSLYWVSAFGEGILRVFTSGPSEQLLDHCQRKNGRLQQDQKNHNIEEICENNLEKKDNERFALYWDLDDYEDDYYYDGSNSEYEPMKDLTACDKECGYCGNCDY